MCIRTRLQAGKKLCLVLKVYGLDSAQCNSLSAQAGHGGHQNDCIHRKILKSSILSEDCRTGMRTAGNTSMNLWTLARTGIEFKATSRCGHKWEWLALAPLAGLKIVNIF
ncbi:hypothetical protein JTB14_001076 [Gonioctena quinquepunctata]|nr:hypothetical protein JTB14_001076 [Gonioctena quinquepunctata]